MGTELATRQTSAVSVTDDELAAVKSAICPTATPAELRYFAGVCESKGISPLSGMCYLVKRGPKLSIQTGIDGFRSIAEATGEYRGMDGPWFCGEDGEWKDLWVGGKPPYAAKVIVHRAGYAPRTVIRLWSEYGKNAGPIANQQPAHMLAKSAESIGLRQQFPALLGGLFTDDEMVVADGRNAPTGQAGADTLDEEQVANIVRLSLECGAGEAEAKKLAEATTVRMYERRIKALEKRRDEIKAQQAEVEGAEEVEVIEEQEPSEREAQAEAVVQQAAAMAVEAEVV